MLKKILQYIFPIECQACERTGSLLCNSCCDLIPKNEPIGCFGCNKETLLGATCASCKADIHFDRLFVITSYDVPVVQHLIWMLKYQYVQYAANALAGLVGRYLETQRLQGMLRLQDTVLIPVPTHPKKLKKRGYNQTYALCGALSSKTRLEADFGLFKAKHTLSQTTFSREERNANIKGSFSYAGEAPRRVILIDDVITTGSTINEAARVLKKAGAQEVIGLVVAHRG